MLIVHINVNYLTQERIVELLLLIETFKIDVVCLNETALKPNKQFSAPGFKIFRFDRPGTTRKGGVLVMVKEDIEAEDLGSAAIDGSEIQLVSIKINKQKSVKIASVYSPPGIVLSQEALNFIKPTPSGFILCGDLNAKNQALGTVGIPNAQGTKVVELLQLHSLRLLTNGQHTYTTLSGKKESLDIFIASEDMAKLVTGVDALPDIGSDHLPLAVELRCLGKRPKSFPQVRLNLNATNWDAYADCLANSCLNWDTSLLDKPASLDEAADIIEKMFLEAQLIIPKVDASKLRPWRPSQEILEAIKARRKARRRFEAQRSTIARTAYNQASSRVKKLIKTARLGRFKHRCETLSKLLKDKPRLFWKEFKSLSNNELSSDRRNYPPIKRNDGQQSFTDADKAETFAKHLHEDTWVNQDSPTFCKGNAERVKRIIEGHKTSLSIAEKPRRDPSGIWTVTADELVHIVKKLKATAPGEDGISNAMLKKAPNIFWQKMADVCNASMKLGFIPEKWKTAVVVLIAKEGKDWTTVKGYRPISLLSAIAKILERVVAKRLIKELRRRKILPETQSAFLGDHGVEDHSFRMAQRGISSIMNRHTTIMTCLDVEGAFDKIWHDGMRCKTIDHGLPEIATGWISNFLDGRTFRVRIGNTISEKYTITGGVPQGSPLSPILYVLFTADLPRVIPKHTDKGIFADDLALIVTNRDESIAITCMNESLVRVKEWFDKWRLKLNAAKSQVIRFSLKRTPPLFAVKLGEEEIKFCDRVKYLGVIFDAKLLFKEHIKDVIGRVDRRVTSLASLCKRRFNIGVEAALTAYKAHVKPLLTFGSPAFAGIDNGLFDKLEIRQNNAIRAIFRAPPWANLSDLRSKANLTTIHEAILDTASDWLARSISAGNLAGREAKSAMSSLDTRTYHKTKRLPLTAMVAHLQSKFQR